jgi:hypothetical protein
MYVCVCTLWRYGPWTTLTSLKTFPSVSYPSLPLFQPLILIFLRSSSTSSIHHFGPVNTPSSFRFAHIQFSDDPVFWHPFYMTQPSQILFAWSPRLCLILDTASSVLCLSWSSRFHCHTLVHRLHNSFKCFVHFGVLRNLTCSNGRDDVVGWSENPWNVYTQQAFFSVLMITAWNDVWFI